MSRAQDRLQMVPFGTLSLICINVAVHGIVFITSFNSGLLSISAYHVIYQHEYYRIVTAAFTHGGILHILMNMMSLLQLGALLEKGFGTVIFLMLSMWSVILCGAFYVFANWALSVLLVSGQGQLYTSAVGYSGVLFTYALISSYHTTSPTQSVFGFFNVPSKIYPWILLGIMQVILPNISLLGHLSGIVVGLLSVYGPLEFLLMPSRAFCREIDENNKCCGINKRSNYCCTTETALTTDSCRGAGIGSVCSTAGDAVMYVVKLVWNVVATILHIIGCPGSVTTLNCCGDISQKISRIFSCFRNQNSSYDDVADFSGATSFSTMQVSDRPAGRSHRLEGGRVPYDRIGVSEPIDIESACENIDVDTPSERDALVVNNMETGGHKGQGPKNQTINL